MKYQTVKIFTKENGIEKLTRKEFTENLDLGVYDGRTIEIVETEC